jgi:N-acetylglutamate synthase-like GNAT family acetyltransferase
MAVNIAMLPVGSGSGSQHKCRYERRCRQRQREEPAALFRYQLDNSVSTAIERYDCEEQTPERYKTGKQPERPSAALALLEDDTASPASRRLASAPAAPGTRPLLILGQAPSCRAYIPISRHLYFSFELWFACNTLQAISRTSPPLSVPFGIDYREEYASLKTTRSTSSQAFRGSQVMAVEYRPITPDDCQAVRQLLSESGWEQRVQDPVRFRTMVERADRTVVVIEDSRVIGFARALCDGVSNGYISTVVVAPDKRGQGIGTEMVKRLMAVEEGGNVTWVLRAGRNSSGFWKSLGFTESRIAMERVRGS